mmetsp:Transcript_806/g.1755  ORF Transcript_806/g.1755 Transcript_806/m.1755 type:complete len:233 (+) Transcript_806:1746-2444(+)
MERPILPAILSKELSSICSSGLMCPCKRHMCAQINRALRLIMRSLKPQCTLGSTAFTNFSGNTRMSSVSTSTWTIPLASSTLLTRPRLSFLSSDAPALPLAAAQAGPFTNTTTLAAIGRGKFSAMTWINVCMLTRPTRLASAEAATKPGPSLARTSLSMHASSTRMVSADTPLVDSCEPRKQQHRIENGTINKTAKKTHKVIRRFSLLTSKSGWRAMLTLGFTGPSGLPYFS